MSNYGTNGNGRCNCRTGVGGRAVPAAGRGFGGYDRRAAEYQARVADDCGCGTTTNTCGCGTTTSTNTCGCVTTDTTGSNSCGCTTNGTTATCSYDSCINSYPLAMAYVPCQSLEDLYCEEEALCCGTIFKRLYLPFTGRRVCNGK